jgi:hypothetical protein
MEHQAAQHQQYVTLEVSPLLNSYPPNRVTPSLGIKSVMVSIELLPRLHRSIADPGYADLDPDPSPSFTHFRK